VDRILRKNGVLAVWGYPLNHFKNENSTKIISKFFNEKLGEYWSKRRLLLDNLYRDIDFPYKETMETVVFTNNKTMTLENYVNYISTWSAYNQWKSIHKSDQLLKELQQE
jgi:trans-aconitate 3-methyltransferase